MTGLQTLNHGSVITVSSRWRGSTWEEQALGRRGGVWHLRAKVKLAAME